MANKIKFSGSIGIGIGVLILFGKYLYDKGYRQGEADGYHKGALVGRALGAANGYLEAIFEMRKELEE